MRPAPLSVVAGPQGAAVTVGYVAAVAPSLTVMPVADDGIDATAKFLLSQTLLAIRHQEEEAREREEVEEMEEKVAKRLLRLAEAVEQFRGRDWSQLSDLERIACAIVAHSAALKEEEKRKKRKKRRRRRSSWRSLISCSHMMSHFSLFTAVMSFFHEPLVSDSHLLVLVRLWSTGSRIFPGCLVRQWYCSCFWYNFCEICFVFNYTPFYVVSRFLRSILALLLLWRSVHSRCFRFVFCPCLFTRAHCTCETLRSSQFFGGVCGDQRRHESGSLGVLCFPSGGMLVCRLLVDTAWSSLFADTSCMLSNGTYGCCGAVFRWIPCFTVVVSGVADQGQSSTLGFLCFWRWNNSWCFSTSTCGVMVVMAAVPPGSRDACGFRAHSHTEKMFLPLQVEYVGSHSGGQCRQASVWDRSWCRLRVDTRGSLSSCTPTTDEFVAGWTFWGPVHRHRAGGVMSTGT